MTCKPGFRRRPLDLLYQPRFADPSLAADIHSLAAPGLAARRQRRLQQAEFSPPTDEWPLLAHNRP